MAHKRPHLKWILITLMVIVTISAFVFVQYTSEEVPLGMKLVPTDVSTNTALPKTQANERLATRAQAQY